MKKNAFGLWARMRKAWMYRLGIASLVFAIGSFAAAACVIPVCRSCTNPNPPPAIGGRVDFYDDDYVPPRRCEIGPCQPFTC